MQKKVNLMSMLLVGALIVLLGSSLINGVLWGILREWYFNVARTSQPEWEWLYGGAKFVASAKTALIHFALVAVCFTGQLVLLFKCKRTGLCLIPMFTAVGCWLVSEGMHALWGNLEPGAYVLCALALHGMFGTWSAWTAHVLVRKEKE